MADMKMRKHEGGYLLGLTPGQRKKWEHLPLEVHVKGTIATKKWDATEYTLTIDDDVYAVTATGNSEAKTYKVVVTHVKTKQSNERVYRTYEANDCVMRMVLELHNAQLAARATQVQAAQEKKRA